MKYFIALIFTFFLYTVSAQDSQRCMEIVNIAVDAVNNHSVENLHEHLAPDFVCAGQSGPIAIQVLAQIITQIDEHISNINKIDERQADATLTLVYDFNYSKRLGHKEATFIFNSDNQIKQMDLLPVQVKKVDMKKDFETPSDDVITVPMEISDGLIFVKAELNGIERDFILDSGAPSLYLNSKYFSHTNDTVNSISSAQGVSSGISGQDVFRVNTFNFHGIRAENTDFVMSDISHLSKDREIYGLIGYQVLKDYDWLFDYEGKTLTLIKSDKTENYIKEMRYNTYEVPMQMTSEKSHIPFIETKIGDITLMMGIDCGAAVNLIDDSMFSKLEKRMSNISTTELNGASKESTTVKNGDIKSLNIGKKRFKHLPTVFSDISHLNARWTNKIDGLLGYEILSRQKLIMSINNKKLIFIE